MITSTMNSTEIGNMVDKDRDRIQKFILYRYKEMERSMRKGFSKNCSRVIDYSTPNSKYKIVLYIVGKFHTFTLLALNVESNEWLDVTFSRNRLGRDIQYVARSVHFFNRYAERFWGATNMSLNQIMQKFFMEMNCFIVFYRNNDHIVYAGPNGLILATFDEAKEIVHVVTFVSAEMLKKSQFSAWLKVWGACKRISEKAEREVRENGNLSPDVTCYWGFTEKERLTIDEAAEIYSSFFKTHKNAKDNRV